MAKKFNKRKAIQRVVGNTLMAFSFPFTGSTLGQQMFDGDFQFLQSLFVGGLAAMGAFLFTAGHELTKRGRDNGKN